MKHRIPAGEMKFLTVDVKTLQANQRLHKEAMGNTSIGNPPCWIQVGGDKQNKINCWNVTFISPAAGAFGTMRYGHPSICGAMVYVETDVELEYET